MPYIELNPVRAGMVAHPGKYKWSSYAHNAKEDLLNSSHHTLYRALDNIDESRLVAYRELFRFHMGYKILHEIRDAVNQELVLGREDFKAKTEKMTKRQTRRGCDGRPPRRIEEEQAIYLVL